MACSYTSSIPSTFATSGYAYPANVESLLRNKVDLYSTLPVERSLAAGFPSLSTPFVNAGFDAKYTAPAVAPVDCGVQTGRVYGAECGAKLAQIIAARLNTFVGQEVAVQIGAQWGAEICAKLGAELAVRLCNGWSVEQCTRWCSIFGAEKGAELATIIAQRLGGLYTAEFAARIGSSLFADVCAKLCFVVAARIQETRFGGNFNNFNTFGYPTSTGFDARFGGLFNNWTGVNTPAYTDKLYNIAFRPSSNIALYTLTNPIRIQDREGNRMLQLCFELKGFKPEEVTVTFNKAERAVIIEAAYDAKDGKEHQVTRKYSRKFVLPEYLAKSDLSKIELKSSMNADGYLTVEAQLPKMTAEEITKCPTMSKAYEMSAFGYNMFNTFGGMDSLNDIHNSVKPVTVKTA